MPNSTQLVLPTILAQTIDLVAAHPHRLTYNFTSIFALHSTHFYPIRLRSLTIQRAHFLCQQLASPTFVRLDFHSETRFTTPTARFLRDSFTPTTSQRQPGGSVDAWVICRRAIERYFNQTEQYLQTCRIKIRYCAALTCRALAIASPQSIRYINDLIDHPSIVLSLCLTIATLIAIDAFNTIVHRSAGHFRAWCRVGQYSIASKLFENIRAHQSIFLQHQATIDSRAHSNCCVSELSVFTIATSNHRLHSSEVIRFGRDAHTTTNVNTIL